MSSTYKEVMTVDTDIIWFKNPDKLFDAPLYREAGAMYFRDRFIKGPSFAETDARGWALQVSDVYTYIYICVCMYTCECVDG